MILTTSRFLSAAAAAAPQITAMSPGTSGPSSPSVTTTSCRDFFGVESTENQNPEPGEKGFESQVPQNKTTSGVSAE